MQADTKGGSRHGVAGKAQGANQRDQSAAAGNVDRVGRGAPDDQQRAQHQAITVEPQILREHDSQAEVADEHADQLPSLDGSPEESAAYEHDDRRVDIKDETLQPGADVLQAHEVENAGDIVAAQTKANDGQPLVFSQPRSSANSKENAGNQQIKRHRQQHPQGLQSDGVNRIAIAELDNDGLEREQGRADGSEDKADSFRQGACGSRWHRWILLRSVSGWLVSERCLAMAFVSSWRRCVQNRSAR